MALPLTGVYLQRQLDAENAYQQALASLATEERQGYTDMGLQSTDSGPVIDPNLRHGAVQNLMREQAGSLSSLRDQLVGQHLGSYGLAAKRGQLAKFAAQGERGQLASSFQRTLNDLLRRRQEALSNKTREFTGAEQDFENWRAQQAMMMGQPQGNDPYPTQPLGPNTTDTSGQDQPQQGGIDPFDPYGQGMPILRYDRRQANVM